MLISTSLVRFEIKALKLILAVKALNYLNHDYLL